MAQLKDTVVAGSLRATEGIYTNEIQCTKLKALTSASATTNYGVGTNGQILMSNGTNAYWSSDIPTATIAAIGGIKLNYSTSYNTSGTLNVKVSADNNNDAYVSLSSFTTTSYGFGLVPKPGSGDSGKFLCSDGSWQTVSTSGGTTTTELTHATVNTLGGIRLYNSDLQSGYYRLKLNSSDQAYVQVPTFSTTTAGLVPAPTSASSSKFLCSTGSWETIDTSGSGSGSGTTSISPATDSALGGIKTGYSNTANNFAVKLETNTDKAYVTVPSAGSNALGLINTTNQTFSGIKIFKDGAIIGNANANYTTGQPYKYALQLGLSTSSSPQATSYPSITLSEIDTRYLQIKAPYMLLTRNTYECYNSTISYYPDDIVWYAGKYYTNNGSNGSITDTTCWTPMQPLNAIACDSSFAPFIDKKYALGSSTRSWSALYLNGYKIVVGTNGTLTITAVSQS